MYITCILHVYDMYIYIYLVIDHSYGKSIVNGGLNSSVNGPFSIAMLNNQRVYHADINGR